ncbi:MAG: AbrB/MazE/SpoVT family DNA-binding domain-containing protein [Acidimicrobiales bacterium]
MRTTIDRVGRLVIPKALRDQAGLQPGDIEVTLDGAGIRIEALATGDVVERDGRLVVPATGKDLDDETVRALRYGDQR